MWRNTGTFVREPDVDVSVVARNSVPHRRADRESAFYRREVVLGSTRFHVWTRQVRFCSIGFRNLGTHGTRSVSERESRERVSVSVKAGRLFSDGRYGYVESEG